MTVWTKANFEQAGTGAAVWLGRIMSRCVMLKNVLCFHKFDVNLPLAADNKLIALPSF
jgi:hypothetical protein